MVVLDIYDDNFQRVYTLDEYESLIWTERYASAGNFEYYTPMNDHMLEVVNFIQSKLQDRIDTYAWVRGSDSTMIIESIEIDTDAETGSHLIISGQGLEILLDRRVVWNQITLDGYLQGQVEKLLNQNVISPAIAERKIPNFVFKASTDPRITALKIQAQYTGNNLYNLILGLCEEHDMGFRVMLNDQNQFEFSFYYGEDRSYNQTDNTYVVFSPTYENLLNSSYIESVAAEKNVTLVAGEDEGADRKTITVGEVSGMARRELYTDARDIQSEYWEEDEEKVLTPSEYNALLTQRGREKLSENVYVKAFTGEIEGTRSFTYGQDFFMGDIVQVINEYHMETTARVTELVRAYDASGQSMYPTFTTIE